MAAATGTPVRVAGQLMDQVAVPAEDDRVGQFTRDVPLDRPQDGAPATCGQDCEARQVLEDARDRIRELLAREK